MRKKNLSQSSVKKTPRISPDEAMEFIESFKKMLLEKDEPTKLISIRIPENILNVLKTHAKTNGKKYQSLIVEILRKELKNIG